MKAKDFVKNKGLEKRVNEDWNPYIIYDLMEDYAKMYFNNLVPETTKKDFWFDKFNERHPDEVAEIFKETENKKT